MVTVRVRVKVTVTVTVRVRFRVTVTVRGSVRARVTARVTVKKYLFRNRLTILTSPVLCLTFRPSQIYKSKDVHHCRVCDHCVEATYSSPSTF